MNTLKNQMAKGIVKFQFIKADGTLRTAYGTRNPRLIETLCPNNDERETSRTQNPNVMAYFDLVKNAWRSFRIDRFDSVLKAYDNTESACIELVLQMDKPENLENVETIVKSIASLYKIEPQIIHLNLFFLGMRFGITEESIQTLLEMANDAGIYPIQASEIQEDDEVEDENEDEDDEVESATINFLDFLQETLQNSFLNDEPEPDQADVNVEIPTTQMSSLEPQQPTKDELLSKLLELHKQEEEIIQMLRTM